MNIDYYFKKEFLEAAFKEMKRRILLVLLIPTMPIFNLFIKNCAILQERLNIFEAELHAAVSQQAVLKQAPTLDGKSVEKNPFFLAKGRQKFSTTELAIT